MADFRRHGDLPSNETIVVKIGSSSLVTTEKGGKLRPRLDRIADLVRQISILHSRSCKVVLVSSGAVACGYALVDTPSHHPRLESVEYRRCYAAIGQPYLMNRYAAEFTLLGKQAAQILVAASDFKRHESYNNLAETVRTLLHDRFVPVVNGNDTLSDAPDDNDSLAALLAAMIRANRLIMIGDQQGIYSSDPNRSDAHILEVVEMLDENVVKLRNQPASKSQFGSGGVHAKLAAAEIASWCGTSCVVVSAKIDNALLNGTLSEPPGSFVPARRDRPLTSIQAYAAFAEVPKGSLFLDEGAIEAISNRSDLLLRGVKRVEGSWNPPSVVRLRNLDGNEIGRALIRLDDDTVITGVLANQRGKLIDRDEIAFFGSERLAAAPQ